MPKNAGEVDLGKGLKKLNLKESNKSSARLKQTESEGNESPSAHTEQDTKGDENPSTPEERDLRIFYWHVNVDSLNTHFGKLKKNIKSYATDVDIVCITEPNKPSGNVNINGYDLHITPTKGKKGGAAIYVKSPSNKFTGVRRLEEVELACQPCGSDCKDCAKVVTHESVWIEFERRKDKKMIVVGTIYRHPDQHVDRINCFINKIDNALEHPEVKGKLFYLLGDFNINLLKDTKSKRKFLWKLGNHGSKPLNDTAPTCFKSKKEPTLVDHIHTNDDQAKKSKKKVSKSNDFLPHRPIYCIV